MKLELVNIDSDRDVQVNDLLAGRLRQNPAHKNRIRFIARSEGQDVGLLFFDRPAEKNYAVLYEIFVLPDVRRRKVGSALVGAAEAKAQEWRRKYLVVFPRSLSPDLSDSALRNWYGNLGFQVWTEDPNCMVKEIPQILATEEKTK